MADFRLEDWPVIFAEYTTAKAALQDAVGKERVKLDKAQAEYAAAIETTPAKAHYDEARDIYNAFRRWAYETHGAQLSNPTVESAVPGVTVTKEA